MEFFIAQKHSAMTHMPIAAGVMVAICAIAALFTSRKEVARAWAALSILALVTALPAIASGIAAAEGRYNGEGKPYIQSGLLVSKAPANERIWCHELLGAGGTGVASILAALGLALLRGRNPNKYVIAALAVALAVLWGIGAHLGGEDLWGPDTFPAFK